MLKHSKALEMVSEFVGKERANEIQESSTSPDVHPDIRGVAAGRALASAYSRERPTPSAQHQKMMQMHEQQMEAMKADVEKMKSSLAQMKANLLTIKDTNEMARWRNNVDMWEVMVDHMDVMLKHMESMGPGMMGPGLMHRGMDGPPPSPPAEKKPE
jgi:hypothetical protein